MTNPMAEMPRSPDTAKLFKEGPPPKPQEPLVIPLVAPYLSDAVEISTREIRELLRTVDLIATKPAQVRDTDLLLAAALFSKVMNCRTAGYIQSQTLIGGKPVVFTLNKE